MPQTTARSRSQMQEMTVFSASRKMLVLRTPAPPRRSPGPGESVSTSYSYSVVRIGFTRSWPSTGCDISPVPKHAVVTLQRSRPLRPPQPPGS